MLADTYISVPQILGVLLLVAGIVGAVYLLGRAFGRGAKDSD